MVEKFLGVIKVVVAIIVHKTPKIIGTFKENKDRKILGRVLQVQEGVGIKRDRK